MECRQEQREEGGGFLLSQLPELACDGPADAEFVNGASTTGMEWPYLVCRQFECRGEIGELFFPIDERLFPFGSGLPRALPVGKVGILDGKNRQVDGSLQDHGRIEFGELMRKDPHRPFVDDTVMEREQQNRIVVAQFHPEDSPQWCHGEIKWPTNFFEHYCVKRLVFCVTCLRIPSNLASIDQGLIGRGNALHQRVVTLNQRGPQRLVPRGDLVEGTIEDHAINLSRDAKSDRLVIRCVVRKHRLHQPHRMLSKREGEWLLTIDARNCEGLFGSIRCLFQFVCQPFNRWVFKNPTNRDLALKLLTKIRHNPHREQ